MDSKQFAWTYVVTHGRAGMKPSYYGGMDIADSRISLVFQNAGTFKGFIKVNEVYMGELKTIGVDWNKTEAPESHTYGQFTDTFHDPDQVECLRGVLVLKNGLTQSWYADSIEVTNVFDMMEQVANGQTKFYEIFGV